MNSCELVSIVTALACGIAKCVPKEELPILIAIFGELASTLGTITVYEEICKDKKAASEITPDIGIITVPPIEPLL